MSKRLAITVAGAVSLGSYEAGVLYEVLDALKQHNADPATPAAERITIDVLTGASAGGMTAIILAQKLLFNADEFAGPYDNPLYNVWVKRIDLKGLQQCGDDEPALHSLFSSNLVERISHETLLARYDLPAIKPAAQLHPVAAPELRVGVALTNLNGVNYGYPVKGYPVHPDSQFIYTKFTDQMTKTLSAATDSREDWELLRQAAVSCGAFPIAFRAQDMVRSAKGERDDYPMGNGNLLAWDNDPRPFTYTDGGVLQNQPIGIAKNLVDQVDDHHDQENRFYLFVSPHAKSGDCVNSFRESNADFLHMVGRLAKVALGQAGFQDWITAQTLNARVEKLDERASGLRDAIKAGKIDVGSLEKTAASMLELLFPNNTHQPPGAVRPETLEEAQRRVATQYKDEMADLDATFGGGSAQAAAFRDAVLTFESAAGLGARDTMRIYGVTALESELAGAGIQYFLGFFDQNLRDHDYDVGRSHGREFLKSALAGGVLAAPGELGPIRFDAARNDIRPIDDRYKGQALSKLPVADIRQFHTGMKQRVRQMLKELIGGWSVVVDPAVDLLIDHTLDQVIARL